MKGKAKHNSVVGVLVGTRWLETKTKTKEKRPKTKEGRGTKARGFKTRGRVCPLETAGPTLIVCGGSQI